MPHTGSPPCSSGDGIRRAEKDTEPLILCPGLNGALSPASPPGFVTALTTARSRDVPAECFDERLPRRLPHRRSPGACIYSLSRKLQRSHRARWSSTANMISYKLPPHSLRNDAANSNGYAAKKKLTALKLYEKFRSTTPVTASRAMMMGWWIR